LYREGGISSIDRLLQDVRSERLSAVGTKLKLSFAHSFASGGAASTKIIDFPHRKRILRHAPAVEAFLPSDTKL
jgi:hypothetical protein